MSATQALSIAGLAALNLWIALRFSGQPLGQDEGLWMLWGFTGARPYRDHVDCKPPGIHLWVWLLAQVTRRNLARTKFLHHAAIGGFAIAAYALSGNLNAGLLFTALAQSAWLQAYHAWVEPLSSGFLLLGLLAAPWPAVLCLGLAAFFNLKLAPPGLALLVARGWWPQLAVACFGAAALLALFHVLWPAMFRDVWYGAVTVAARLTGWRKRNKQALFPRWDGYFAQPLLLIVPATAAALVAHRNPALWIVAAVYIVENTAGRVWRPYHWIPLGAIAAAAAPSIAGFVLLGEWLASGLYLGDVVERTRPDVAQLAGAAKAVGERLRNVEGSLWLDSEFTQIYVYALKRPARSLVEQVEIRHVVPERRAAGSRGAPRPDILVVGPTALLVVPSGYHKLFTHGPFAVFATKGVV